MIGGVSRHPPVYYPMPPSCHTYPCTVTHSFQQNLLVCVGNTFTSPGSRACWCKWCTFPHSGKMWLRIVNDLVMSLVPELKGVSQTHVRERGQGWERLHGQAP